MLNTENQQLSDDWREILTSNTQDICVFAPRRSGKTTALLKLFVDTPNSKFISINRPSADLARNWVNRNYPTFPVVTGNIISSHDYRFDSQQPFLGEHFDTIFLDELSYFRLRPERIMEMFHFCCDRVVAASTPSGFENLTELRRYFRCFDFNTREQIDMLPIHDRPEPQEPLREMIEHFKEQGDLFEI